MGSWTCIIVNFSGGKTASDWRAALRGYEFPMRVECYTRAEAVLERLENGEVGAMVVFANKNSTELEMVLDGFQKLVGCLPDHQAAICDEPQPMFLAHLLEFGIDTILPTNDWPTHASAFIRSVETDLRNPDSLERRIMKLTRALIEALPDVPAHVTGELKDMAHYDFRAAVTHGRAMIASDRLAQAEQSLAQASQINKGFKPASRTFADILMEFGRFREAASIFEQLCRQNPESSVNNSSLALAHLALGNLKDAAALIDQAGKLDKNSTGYKEALAQLRLTEKRFSEASDIIRSMKNCSTRFVNSLNKFGIDMSQQGFSDRALELFNLAHQVCHPRDAHKVSINAAIACLGLDLPYKALDYIRQCEQEYGGCFPKLDKLRLIAEMAAATRELAA
jgi:tetratricopeptide (TPR) repeat protein